MKLPTELSNPSHPFRFQVVWKKKWAEFVFTIFLIGFISIVLLSQALNSPISHDEYQFVAGAQFFKANGLLPYVDYPFLHMPYMPIISSIFLNFGEYDLFLIRLFNQICMFTSTLLLFFFTTQLFKDSKTIFRLGIGTLSVLLFLTNSSMATMDGRALNHAVPLLLGILIVCLFWKITQNKPRGKILFICGLLIGIAIGTRLNYAVLIIPMLFAILFDPFFKDRKEQIHSFVSFCSGLIIALLPAVVLFLLAPKPFIYGNLHYIALNTIYRWNLGYPNSMNLSEKLIYFYKNVLTFPENLPLYIAWAGFFITAFINWLRTKERGSFLIIFVYIFGTVLLLSAFSPTPLFPQYFSGPVPFLIIGLFLGLSEFYWNQRIIELLILTVLLATLVADKSFLEISSQLKELSRPQQWTIVQMHQLGEEIRKNIICAQRCKLLTLLPILPLEANLDTYPMFTVGSFSWRTAPLLSKERRNEYKIISYDDLPEFLKGDPPVAILTGTEANYDGFTKYDPGGLDQPFIDYAIKNNYHPVKVLDKTDQQDTYLTLWLK